MCFRRVLFRVSKYLVTPFDIQKYSNSLYIHILFSQCFPEQKNGFHFHCFLHQLCEIWKKKDINNSVFFIFWRRLCLQLKELRIHLIRYCVRVKIRYCILSFVIILHFRKLRKIYLFFFYKVITGLYNLDKQVIIAIYLYWNLSFTSLLANNCINSHTYMDMHTYI